MPANEETKSIVHLSSPPQYYHTTTTTVANATTIVNNDNLKHVVICIPTPSKLAISAPTASWLPTWLVAFFTLFMTAAGSSFMAIPYTFVLAPPWLVVLCMMAVAGSMALSCELLTLVYIQTGLTAFHELAERAFGLNFARCLKLGMICALFGSCVASAKIVIDLSPEVCRLLQLAVSSSTAATIVLTLFLMIVFPLNLVKNVSSLEFANYLGALATVCLVAVVWFRAATTSTPSPLQGGPDAPPINLWMGLPHDVSTFNYAFSSVYNVLPMFVALRKTYSPALSKVQLDNQSHAVMARVIIAKVCALTGVYTLFALMAIRLYGAGHIKGDALLNLSNDSLMVLPRMAVLLAVVFTFPLNFQPMFLMAESMATGDPHGLRPKPRAMLSLSFLLATILVSVLAPGIQSIFALCGGVFVSINSFLFPIAVYLRLVPSKPLWRQVLCYTVACGIIFSGVLATTHVLQGHA